MNQSDNSNNNQNNFQIFRPIPTKISSINKIIQFTMDKSEDNNNSSVNKDIFDGKMRSSCFEKSLQLSVNKKQTYYYRKTKYKDTLAQVQKQHGGRLPGKASLIRAKYQEQLVK